MTYLNLHFFHITLIDFLYFAVHPKSSVRSIEPAGSKVITSVFLFLIKFTFSVLIASLIGIFYEPQNLTDQSMSERFSPLVYIAVGGMILPFFEEILFRLSLVFKSIYISLSLACGTYYLLTKVVFGSKLSLVDDTFLIRVGVGLAVGLISFLIFRNSLIKQFLSEFWKNNFKWIYYVSAVIFAWLHVFNFELSLLNLLLMPILTLPQLFSGLISGYLRIRFGFIYPLLLHVGTNTLLIGLSLLVE
jgi:membrane protease YdiL (CAAX protease family)